MTTIPPIRKSVCVPLSPDRAFELFTTRLPTWWPLETHSLSAGTGAVPEHVLFEPRLGGKILETLADGTTQPWAEITLWDPPHHFEMAWHVGRARAAATRVSVTFKGTDTGTQVDLIHDGFEALGESATSTAENYRSGWDPVLARFVQGGA